MVRAPNRGDRGTLTVGRTTISSGSLNLASLAVLTATTNVVVQSGGTLLLGAANQVNSAANLNLAGGLSTWEVARPAHPHRRSAPSPATV